MLYGMHRICKVSAPTCRPEEARVVIKCHCICAALCALLQRPGQEGRVVVIVPISHHQPFCVPRAGWRESSAKGMMDRHWQGGWVGWVRGFGQALEE